MLIDGDQHASAMSAIVCYVLIAVLFYGVLATVHFVYLCCVKHKFTSYLSSIIQTIGALFYFYGDNTTHLLRAYGDEFNCDIVCQKNNRIAATISLGLALIIFQIVPLILKKLYELIDKKGGKKKSSWLYAVDMIGMIVKMDTLYSAVAGMAKLPELCSKSDVGVSASFIIICVVVGIVAEIMYCIYALASRKRKKSLTAFRIPTVVALVLVIICFPLYMLVDNHQPLDCVFQCENFSQNTTIVNWTCDQYVESGIRLAGNCFIFVAISSVSLYFFICNALEKRKSYTELGFTELGGQKCGETSKLKGQLKQ